MIGERLSQHYIVLLLSDAVATAHTRLKQRPGVVGIVIDEEERPVTIISADDLVDLDVSGEQPLSKIAGQLPPGVVTHVTVGLRDFVLSPEFTAIHAGARGAIVYDDDELAGFLPGETITQYLHLNFEPSSETRRQAEGSQLTASIPSSRLAGGIVEKPIIMYCDEFSHRNELAYYNRRRPPQCQVRTPRPHPIRQQR